MARVSSGTGAGGLAAFHQYNRQRQEHMFEKRNYQGDGNAGGDMTSPIEDIMSIFAAALRTLWNLWNDRGRAMALKALLASLRRLRQNLTPRRVFSLPHMLVAVWVLVLLWGERWVFSGKVEKCDWGKWENWPSGAEPHHLVLVADPQLIDPHTYPGRPWPLNPLTYMITDNYLRRSYNQLQTQLQPDSVFFLGDLFDGGREWKTAHGKFEDPPWGHRPQSEVELLKSWNKKYGENFWLKEYGRFSDIFIKPWIQAGQQPGAKQGRRKLIASLPGNHDLGFGSEIKLPVRTRFEAYFGEGNRVDVVGNHSIVSVDSVSLSAGSSDQRGRAEVQKIYDPVMEFLDSAKDAKRKAVEREFRLQGGDAQEAIFPHKVEDTDVANFKERGILSASGTVPDLPTILLSHVPLFRASGLPCGPMREHWPAAKPPKGQKDPVNPDPPNALTNVAGYQYQNMLTEQDSVLLLEKIGNVVHAFSGDDHDYCEVKHDANQGGVKEITIKSISMAMGVPTPGFLMVSMWNPLDAQGKPLAGSDGSTLQTHLCLLPNQLATFSKYAGFICITLVILGIRAFLVPVLNLQHFALDPSSGNRDGPLLPVYKAKVEDYDEYELPSVSAGFSASRYSGSHSGTRDRSGSFAPANPAGLNLNGLVGQARNAMGGGKRSHSGHHGHHHSPKGPGNGKWGWGGSGKGPKIEIRADDAYYDGGKWKAASVRRGSSNLAVVLRELWTSTFRVAWMVVAFWLYLAWKG